MFPLGGEGGEGSYTEADTRALRAEERAAAEVEVGGERREEWLGVAGVGASFEEEGFVGEEEEEGPARRMS